MDIKRGLIRVWIVVSLIYGAVFLWVAGPDAVSSAQFLFAKWQVNPDILTWPSEVLDRYYPAIEQAWRVIWNFALGAVVLPALFWALLPGVFWVARGFKGKQ